MATSRAWSCAKRWLQADPNDDQARRDLSILYDRLGDRHLKIGKTDQALKYYQQEVESAPGAGPVRPQ